MLANDGGTIYSVDIDSIYVFKRGALRKTEANPDEAVRQSDVVITVKFHRYGPLLIHWFIISLASAF